MNLTKSPDHGVSNILSYKRLKEAINEYPQYTKLIERIYINSYKYILYMRRYKLMSIECITQHDDFWDSLDFNEIPKQSRIDKALEDIMKLSKKEDEENIHEDEEGDYNG